MASTPMAQRLDQHSVAVRPELAGRLSPADPMLHLPPRKPDSARQLDDKGARTAIQVADVSAAVDVLRQT